MTPILMLLAVEAGAAEVRTQVEAGAEADSNPLRVDSTLDEAVPVEGAGVARTTARLEMTGRPNGRQVLGLSLLGAGKKFVGSETAAAADVAVASTSGRWVVRLGDEPAALVMQGGYYEAFERGPLGADPDLRRDFRTFFASGGLSMAGPPGHQIAASVGARRFTYKPSASLDFDGQWLTLAWTRSWGGNEQDPLEAAGTLELRGSYSAGRRAYDTRAFTNVCTEETTDDVECFRGTAVPRTDLVHVAALELTHQGDRIVGAGYELEWTDSNSFGESVLWHKLSMSATIEAPAEVVVTARAVVQLTRFLDPLFLPGSGDKPFFTIEDENRNSLALHATREIADGWGLEARYALSTNELSEEEATYRRHTLYAGVVWYTMEP